MRPENWPDLLASYIGESSALTFEWGTNDCALWVCGWIKLLNGTDYGEHYRGKYEDEAGANAILSAYGYASLQDLADEHLVETPLKFTRRGDVVLSPTGALGICNGIKSHFLSLEGMIAIPTYSCLRAWRV